MSPTPSPSPARRALAVAAVGAVLLAGGAVPAMAGQGKPTKSDQTTSKISCGPSTVSTGGTTSCTATVADTTTPSLTPTGTVAWTSSAGGSFNNTTCQLSGGSCDITYAPASSGATTIKAAYLGSTGFSPSSATTQVTAVTPSISLTCSPTVTGGIHFNSGLLGAKAGDETCTASVQPTSTGQVTFTSSSPAGDFISGPSCNLDAYTSSCWVEYMPAPSAAVSPDLITATFGSATAAASVSIDPIDNATWTADSAVSFAQAVVRCFGFYWCIQPGG